MLRQREELKVGKFFPNQNRHFGFRFIDSLSGYEQSFQELDTDPNDLRKHIAVLSTYVDGCLVDPPLNVAWDKRVIREASPFIATVEHSIVRIDPIVTRIAVGSLAIQFKE